MPFVRRLLEITAPCKASLFLSRLYGSNEAQKILDRGRFYQNGVSIKKGMELKEGNAFILEFEPKDLFILPFSEGRFTRSKDPIKVGLEEEVSKEINFIIYNKPANLLTHPKKLDSTPSMLDQVKFDNLEANLAHRLDYETSGLLLCGKDKQSEIYLKNLFQEDRIYKEYVALVRGKLTKAFIINKAITNRAHSGDLCVRGRACEGEVLRFDPCEYTKEELYELAKNLKLKHEANTKGALTIVYPLKVTNFFTKVLLIPLTGRTHQLRIHLDSIKHKIINDPLYGVSNEEARIYLDAKESYLTTNTKPNFRLMLHAYKLKFEGLEFCAKEDF
ncbi:hypothetical protein BKH43_06845 [Helicobacter sp. 13S00401-1]|uniref:pseudouridine synthase family protein n=1 Tax=Helicobacter sp. 13S00401-1 TaxID=1905758 RepID=UPI000BA76550|nr:RluA family pseudouridine synthase [Helicobacter sp. 13S00401-1]PAF49360.1 hypothetical protein BKH43_06845 [Helicobacter sp. 13S00401-1]